MRLAQHLSSPVATAATLSCRRLAGRHWQPCRHAALHSSFHHRGSNLAVHAVPRYEDEGAPHGRASGASAAEDFQALSKHLTGLLASEFASDTNKVYKKLESWLTGSQDEGEEVPPRTDQTTTESDGKRLLRQAAEMWGMPTSVSEVVTSVQSWLSNPEGSQESHDTQMVARLVHRLLETYEKQAGEEFEGVEERQWDRLYAIARRVLGSSISRKVLKGLVRAYLGLP